MNELSDKERADRYKQLYNSELALRLDLETEVKFLNNLINQQEYSTPEKIAEDYNKHIAEQKKSYIVGHKEVQEAIDKTVKYLSEIRPDSLKVFAVEHLKQLYKIQIAMLGRLDIK